jgi:hypothetical protein
MRRSIPAALSALLVCLPAVSAQQAKPAQNAAKTTDLPVTSVSLYKNGVGFFEPTGHITGNANVTIDFTNSQLNDVLQSLTAVDLNGGRIAGADYNSPTPLDQQLKNLPVALGEDPTAIEFYNAIRGSRVEVRSGTVSISGRLLSMEERTTPQADSNDARTPTQKDFLTVVSDTGETRTLELNSATSVRLLDTSLQTDVTRYLQLLDSTRNQGLRHLTLTDNGPEGPGSKAARELRISYISEVPVWKSTYRILFTDKGKNATQTATLQGWSVVDNTTGADWINVHLSLIAGAPQSFIQPLSQPIYSRRPEIPIATEAQLTPQTYDSSIESDTAAAKAPPPPPPPPMPMMANTTVRRGVAGGASYGVIGGMAGGTGSGIGAASPGALVDGSAMSYQDEARASIAPATTTAAFDDFFAYNLTEPVTIRKNESALVPILQAKVLADRVTLASYRNGAVSQPLRALWLTNSTGLTLDRGSFSIVEDGNFGGEGLLDPIHAGEKRLLSYAADQAVHISTEGDKTTNHITFIRGSKGVVNIHRADQHEVTFVIHNSAADRRTVVTEVPVVEGWRLSEALKPDETTATVYRFRTEVAPGETVRLSVPSEHAGYTTYYLERSDDNQLHFILQSSENNPALTAALQPIIDARHKLAGAQAAVDQTNQRLTGLRSDEDRQRANITALASADKASRDRFVHDLNATEDAIAAAQAELVTRTAALEAAKADLAAKIEAFQIDTK